MPEQKPPRWGAPDNAKLLRLFQDHQRDPRTGVDPQNKDRKYIKEVCTKHFHGREYKNFRPVFLSKAQEFIVNLEISGSRRGKL